MVERNTLCRLWFGIITALLILDALVGRGQDANKPLIPERVLTNISEIWGLSRDIRKIPHRIRTEVVIYFFEAEWNNAFGECQGKPTWLPIADSPLPLKPGQRVSIDGVILPMTEKILWDQTRIRILEEGVPLNAEPVAEPSRNPQELKNHPITMEGLIDGDIKDPTHYKLLKAVTTAIKRMGFSALDAQDGAQAVELFQRHKDEIVCVLCDTTMPRMGGWETLAALRQISPDIPVILASGYSEAQVMAGDHPEKPQAFLSKPYEFETLSDVIFCVLKRKADDI